MINTKDINILKDVEFTFILQNNFVPQKARVSKNKITLCMIICNKCPIIDLNICIYYVDLVSLSLWLFL